MHKVKTCENQKTYKRKEELVNQKGTKSMAKVVKGNRALYDEDKFHNLK